jgi:hypothetical protein
MMYSGIFSARQDNHPVECIHYQITGKECPGCGLSRGFSELVRGNLDSARMYNPYSPAIFLFFVFQFFARGLVSLLLFSTRVSTRCIAWCDGLISLILFLGAFGPLYLAYL